MNEHDDPNLTTEHLRIVATLSAKDIQSIDDELLRYVVKDWRKMARVVGSAMGSQKNRVKGVPDLYYAERLRDLISRGVVESTGNVNRMRICEVRRWKT